MCQRLENCNLNQECFGLTEGSECKLHLRTEPFNQSKTTIICHNNEQNVGIKMSYITRIWKTLISKPFMQAPFKYDDSAYKNKAYTEYEIGVINF